MLMLRMVSDCRRPMPQRLAIEGASEAPPVDVGLIASSIPDARNEMGSVEVDAYSSRRGDSATESTSIGE
jgi:hypothetical protein